MAMREQSRAGRRKLWAAMEFIFLILDGEVVRDWSEEQQREAAERMAAFKAPLEAAGRLKDSGGLGDDLDAVRVRARRSGVAATFGPFEDATGIVGGYLVIDCASRDDAVELAEHCPAAQWAPLEVRQLWRG
jgi:hypothetical protein